MAESGDASASRQRERSRDRATSQAPREPSLGVQNRLDQGRLTALETQVNQLSDAILTLGPTLQQLLNYQAASSNAPPNPAQMPFPPAPNPVLNQDQVTRAVQTNMPEVANPNGRYSGSAVPIQFATIAGTTSPSL